MADMKSGVLSTPTLHELNTLMEKRRSELKQLKEGRLKADHLVNRVSDHHAIESAPTAVQKIIPASSESHTSHQTDHGLHWGVTSSVDGISHISNITYPSIQKGWEHGGGMMSENVAEDFISMQNVSDDKQTTSQSLKEAREEIDELRRFSSNQRTELDANESLTALRAKLDEYDEIDHITREADEQMLQLCDNLARTKQELKTAQQQLTDISNEVAIKREENLSLSRELHGALRRVEEFGAVRSDEKEEWQDRQKLTTAAENEEEMIEMKKKLALEKQKNRIALAKGVAAAQQGSQHRQYYQPSLLRVFLVLVGWVGVLGCTAILVMSGEFSSCSVDIVRLAY
eukprot:287768_1